MEVCTKLGAKLQEHGIDAKVQIYHEHVAPLAADRIETKVVCKIEKKLKGTLEANLAAFNADDGVKEIKSNYRGI